VPARERRYGCKWRSARLEQYLNNGLLNLEDCTAGETVTVCSFRPGLSCAQRLRELGLVEGSQVLLLKQEDPVLLLIKDSRIAIDPATARQIIVSQLPADNLAAAPVQPRTKPEKLAAGGDIAAHGHGR